jgi:hypothetical protein
MFVFRLNPEALDFDVLAAHLAAVSEDQVHAVLWLKRETVVSRLRSVSAKGTVEAPDRAIYNALRLMVY